MVWGFGGTTPKASWDWLEGQIITEHNKYISLASLWYHPKPTVKLNDTFVQIANVVKIINTRLGTTGTLCPLWKNLLFSAGNNLLINISIQGHNTYEIGKIMKDIAIISFSEMMPNPNNSHFLSYLQQKVIITKVTWEGASIGCSEHLDNGLKKLPT